MRSSLVVLPRLATAPAIAGWSRYLGAAGLLGALVVPAVAFAANKRDKERTEDEEAEEAARTPAAEEFREAGDDEEETADPKRLDEADTEDDSDPEQKDDDDFTDDDSGDDLQFNDDSEQDTVQARGPGEDTAQIYRDYEKKIREMNPDEEQIKWEEYLNRYPKSMFRDRIQAHMEELSNAEYSERIRTNETSGIDAKDREIQFMNGWHLMGVDPRSKVSAGFEIGIPNWFGLQADFEYQLLRQFSAHAGVKHGLGGWELGAGGKYAILKSARTNTILTVAVDVGLHTLPANLYPTVSPTIAFGQRFNVLGGLDVAAQVSMVPEFHTPLQARYGGGVTAELRANETVYAFVETAVNMSPVADRLFAFDTVSFGLRFVPTQKVKEDGSGKAVVGLGANLPYYHNYWQLYQGAVNADVNYYL